MAALSHLEVPGSEKPRSPSKPLGAFTQAVGSSLLDRIATLQCETSAHAESLQQAANDFLQSDPLGMRPTQEEAKAAERDKQRQAARAQGIVSTAKKKADTDIFTEFQKEHGGRGAGGLEDGARVCFKRYWKSEPDLARWQRDLGEHSRSQRLLHDVHLRWREDFAGDMMDLAQNHNALWRQRHPAQCGLAAADTVVNAEGRPKRSPCAQQLRELQKRMSPKAKRFGLSVDLAKGGFGSGGDVDIPGMREKPVPKEEDELRKFLQFILSQFKSLEHAFKSMDGNRSGSITKTELHTFCMLHGYQGDLGFMWSKLDCDNNGGIELNEFLKLQPYVLQEFVRTGNASCSSLITVEDKQSGPQALKPKAATATDIVAVAKSAAAQAVQNSARDQMESPPGSASKGPVSPKAAFGDRNRQCSMVSDDDHDLSRSLISNSAARCARDDRDRRSMGSTISGDRVPGGGRGSLDIARKTAEKVLPEIQMPQTLALLLFRNGDRNHTGEACFIRQRPTNLTQLLEQCAKACRPFVLPVESLLNSDLKPVRSLQEVRSGGYYLLKGKEVIDPPPMFFLKCKEEPGPNTVACSLRHVGRVKQNAAADIPAALALAQKRLGTLPSSSLDLFGSPLGQSQATRGASNWEINPKLWMRMSHGGLGCATKHWSFENFPQVLARSASSPGSMIFGEGSAFSTAYVSPLPSTSMSWDRTSGDGGWHPHSCVF